MATARIANTQRIPLHNIEDVFLKEASLLSNQWSPCVSFPPTSSTTDEWLSTGQTRPPITRADIRTERIPATRFSCDLLTRETAALLLAQALSTQLGFFSNYADIFHESKHTFAVEPHEFPIAASEHRQAAVSISEDLRKPRHALLASSLLSPCGALLTWIAMSEDEDD